MREKIKLKIKKWLENEIKNQKLIQYSHWHIDDFDPSLKNKKSDWVNKGIQMLNYANTQLKQFPKNCHLYLSVFLKSKIKPQKIIFKQNSDIENELTTSPPALYLFDDNQEDFFFNKVICKNITIKNIGNLFKDIKCFYSEYFQEGEYFYALWFKINK